MKECKNCQKTYDDNSMFCTECGGRLEESAPRGSFCPNCGTACQAGAAFCTNCGTRLGAPAQAPVYAQPAPQPAPQPTPQRPDVTLTESADDIESVPEEFRGKLKKAKAKHTRSKVLGGINNVINTLCSIFWIILYGLWAAITCVGTGIAYFCGLITIPCGIVQFKSIKLVFSPFKKRVVTHFGKRGFWNVVWIIFGGFALFLSTKVLQLLFNITFIGRRLGAQFGKLATFYLAPFGAQIIADDEFSSEEIERDVYTRQYILRNQFNPEFQQAAEKLMAASKEESKKKLVKDIVFAGIFLMIAIMFFVSGMLRFMGFVILGLIAIVALDRVLDWLTSGYMEKYGYGSRRAVIGRFDQKSRFQKMSLERKVCKEVYPSIAPYVEALIFDEK